MTTIKPLISEFRPTIDNGEAEKMTANLSFINHRDLSLEEQINLVTETPHYLQGGFGSAAKTIAQLDDYQLRQVACFAAAVSKFHLQKGATCFACTDTITIEYNKLAANYRVRLISLGSSTIYTIQKNAENLGVIFIDPNKTTFIESLGKWERHIELVIEKVASIFPKVFNKALASSAKFFNRKLNSGGSTAKNTYEANEYAACGDFEQSQNRSHNNEYKSKDLFTNTKRTPYHDDGFELFFSQFKEDRDEIAYLHNLTNVAKSQPYGQQHHTFTGSNAARYIHLHNKHGVDLNPKIWKFCYAMVKLSQQDRYTLLNEGNELFNHWADTVHDDWDGTEERFWQYREVLVGMLATKNLTFDDLGLTDQIVYDALVTPPKVLEAQQQAQAEQERIKKEARLHEVLNGYDESYALEH